MKLDTLRVEFHLKLNFSRGKFLATSVDVAFIKIIDPLISRLFKNWVTNKKKIANTKAFAHSYLNPPLNSTFATNISIIHSNTANSNGKTIPILSKAYNTATQI